MELPIYERKSEDGKYSSYSFAPVSRQDEKILIVVPDGSHLVKERRYPNPECTEEIDVLKYRIDLSPIDIDKVVSLATESKNPDGFSWPK